MPNYRVFVEGAKQHNKAFDIGLLVMMKRGAERMWKSIPMPPLIIEDPEGKLPSVSFPVANGSEALLRFREFVAKHRNERGSKVVQWHMPPGLVQAELVISLVDQIHNHLGKENAEKAIPMTIQCTQAYGRMIRHAMQKPLEYGFKHLTPWRSYFVDVRPGEVLGRLLSIIGVRDEIPARDILKSMSRNPDDLTYLRCETSRLTKQFELEGYPESFHVELGYLRVKNRYLTAMR